jgi:hypothetical protein
MAMVELALACGVLMVLMAVVGGMFSLAQRGRRDAERHHWALTEASNCLERLSAVSWSELTPQRAEKEALSPSAQEVLGPAARLVASIEEAAGVPTGQKVAVEVRFTNDGRPAPVVRMVTWRYRVAAAGAEP